MNSLSIEDVKNIMRELYFKEHPNDQRRVTIYTGVGGMDNFYELLEKDTGIKRIYIGNKPLRILRKLKGNIHKSYSKGYYRQIINNSIWEL